jgi:hybrid cluster-associated redox disulfide protein
MQRHLPTATHTVAEVLNRWPQTAPVFVRYQTACVGCVMAPFDTLADVATEYGLCLDDLLEALHLAIHATGPEARPPM